MCRKIAEKIGAIFWNVKNCPEKMQVSEKLQKNLNCAKLKKEKKASKSSRLNLSEN